MALLSTPAKEDEGEVQRKKKVGGGGGGSLCFKDEIVMDSRM